MLFDEHYWIVLTICKECPFDSWLCFSSLFWDSVLTVEKKRIETTYRSLHVYVVSVNKWMMKSVSVSCLCHNKNYASLSRKKKKKIMGFSELLTRKHGIHNYCYGG